MKPRDSEQIDRKKIKANFHLKVSLSIIYYTGTWPAQAKNRFSYTIYTICSCTFMLGIFLLSEIMNLIMVWGNVSQMVAGATLLMTNIVHASKIVLILRQQERIQSLLDTTRSETFNRDNVKHESIVSKYAWRGIFHHAAYQSFGAMAVLCWGFTPIADYVAGRGRRLPTEGWYPMNVTISPTFEILCLHQGIAIVVVCCHNIAVDTLVTGFITVACCQLALLKENMISINGDMPKYKPVSSCKSMREREFIGARDMPYKQLRECIKHGSDIFVFVTEIQSIFGWVVFFQFLVNCIIICLIAFHISQMVIYLPEVLIGMLMYLFCMTYQIFIYCWHGNELRLHSASVTLAAYSSNWYGNTQRFKRAIQIIMTRSQMPLILTAGNVLSLSLDTFVKILRMSYSIFTVLQSTTTN